MKLTEIKRAVDSGQVVHWANDGYTVIKGSKGQYLIKHASGHCIGLTWADDVTLNGKESEFYTDTCINCGEKGHNFHPCIEGGFVCNHCYEDGGTFDCTECGLEASDYAMKYDDNGNPYCPECAEGQFFNCRDCGHIVFAGSICHRCGSNDTY